MKNTLQTFDWNSITDKNDIDDCVDSFTKTLMSIAADHIPNYICTVRTMDKPWMTNNIRNQIRKRRLYHKKAKQTNTEYNWTKFRKQRNYVIELIRKAKNDYFEKISIRINTDQNRSSKEWWRLCKSISFGKNNIDSIPPLLYDDEIISNDYTKVNILNEYFTSISNIADADEKVNIHNHPTSHNLENINITSKDVHDIIKSLKVNKASGMDGVSHRILKEAIDSISEPLCKIFNKSLHQGIYPTQWKYANVIPIYKSKETFLPSNYRPVSLLSTISKVFERCVFKYLNTYLC